MASASNQESLFPSLIYRRRLCLKGTPRATVTACLATGVLPANTPVQGEPPVLATVTESVTHKLESVHATQEPRKPQTAVCVRTVGLGQTAA